MTAGPRNPARTEAVTARVAAALRWPYGPQMLNLAWVIFALVNLDAIFMFPGWETIPFHIIWASLALVYGFSPWRKGATLWVLAGVVVLTAGGIAWDVSIGSEPIAELTEDPLIAAMFIAMAWHAHRKQAAENSVRLISEENARLLRTQRQFLQDAAHQLRTPITIALGHAELLAAELSGQQEGDDIQVVIGELSRLRRISERLLVIAAAADPQFLRPEPVPLDHFTMDVIRRWRPTADRRWRIGRLDSVTVQADRERLGLAVDALLENAVRHTGPGDVIQLSVIKGWPGMPARMVVADGGSGIPAERLPLIFERFSTGDDGQSRGTGLGLALVRAVARAHGGDVTVRAAPGEGSEFELTLPAPEGAPPGLPHPLVLSPARPAMSAATAAAPFAAPAAATAPPVAGDAEPGENGLGKEQQGSARR